MSLCRGIGGPCCRVAMATGNIKTGHREEKQEDTVS